MVTIPECLAQIMAVGGEVRPACGLPDLRDPTTERLPLDLRTFYSLCGGLTLEPLRASGLRISSPGEFVLTERTLHGGYLDPGDPGQHWYLLAVASFGDAVSIDLSELGRGRVLNSAMGYHGIPGDCWVIARSFSEFLRRVIENHDDEPYWFAPGFEALGDAYEQKF